MVILPFLTNEPSFPTASVLAGRIAQYRSAPTMVIIQNEVQASPFRRACLSATSASTRMSGWPASTAPVNVPAMPGIRAHMRQKRPVNA